MNDQVDDATPEEVVEAPQLGADTNESEPESSPAPVEVQEENKPNVFQERIDKVTAQKYEQQRRADALEAKLREIEASKPAVTPDMPAPPQMPEDVYDSESMQKYHADMVAYTQQAAQIAGEGAYEKRQRLEQERQQQTAMQQVVSTYAQNAVRDGVDMDKLRAAEQVLNESGISPQLGSYIMNDKNGGKIAEYLHDNPAIMHELLSLDPVTAGIKIATELKPKVLSTNPKVTRAPEPPPEISGGGVLDRDDFERRNPGTTFI